MKTLKYIPVPEGSHHLLAQAENDAYRVIIHYFGEGDLTNKKIEEISESDISVIVMPKDDKYPELSVIMENERAGIEQRFYIDLRNKDFIALNRIDSFIALMKIAGDTLADIKEMLVALGSQFVHAESERAKEEYTVFQQREDAAESMRTLKYLPVPEDNTCLLAWVENDIYEVKIRYFGDQDPSTVNRSGLTVEDLMINVHIKDKAPRMCPQLKVVLGNKSLDIQQWFYIQQRMTDTILLEEIPEFLNLLALARDTLTDIRGILINLIPDFIQ